MVDFRDIPNADMESAVHEAFDQYSLVEDYNSFNFVCPYCGQMSNSEFKKPERKAYVYKDTWNFVCYKCSPMHNVMWEFKESHPEIYRRLMFMMYGKGGKAPQKQYERKYVEGAYQFKDGELVSKKKMTLMFRRLLLSARTVI